MKKMMIRIGAAFLGIAMLTGAACSNKETDNANTDQSGYISGVANPVVDYASLDEINTIVGCAISRPYGYEVTEEHYSVIDGEIAQYDFQAGDIEWNVRAAHTTDDISGVYTDGSLASELIPAEDPYAIITVEQGLYTRWYLGGMQYSLYAAGDVSEETMWYMRDALAYSWPWYDSDNLALEDTADIEQEDAEDHGVAGCEATQIYMGVVADDNSAWGTSFGTGTDLAYQDAANYMYPNTQDIVNVSTADELLAAIKPNAVILLAPGEYDLTKAAGYGVNGEYYTWEEVFDGKELVLHDVNGLTIIGTSETAEDGTVTLSSILSTEPRYAYILRMRSCENITLAALTIGHTEKPGECVGGVVCLENCSTIDISDCDLYGCGTVGIDATSSSDIRLYADSIHDCTYGLLDFGDCSNVQAERCGFFATEGDCGVTLAFCKQISFTDCDFAMNSLNCLFSDYDTEGVTLTNCLIAENYLASSLVFHEGNADTYPYTFGGCAYYDSTMETWQDVNEVSLDMVAVG